MLPLTFFVPDFRISLLSVDQLDFYGYTTTFRSGICSIANTNGRIVLSATLKQGLYILSLDGSAHISEIRSLRTAQHSNTVNIWQQRFAHLNYTDLKHILESNKSRTPWTLMPGLCETCVHTKQQQHVIRTKSSRTSTPFELVHSDLCGPMKHSNGGAQYYRIISHKSPPFEMGLARCNARYCASG